MPISITEVFYPVTRRDWRSWLSCNYEDTTEIWVRRFKKAVDKSSITYDELVEEALCFGWIDSIVKKLDEESTVQRVTPRRPKSFLSELNRQRIWKLEYTGMMTPAGYEVIGSQIGAPGDTLKTPELMDRRSSEDPEFRKNFDAFPHLYRRLKIGWIQEAGTSRPEERQRRLDYLIKMTRQNKRYGTEPFSDDMAVEFLRSRSGNSANESLHNSP